MPRSRPPWPRRQRTADPTGEARGTGWAQLRQRVGTAGEAAAVAHLEGQGVRVIARDWRCRMGQLDLVCEEEGILVAVEVKARRGIGFGLPQEAVDWRKREKLRRLLDAFRVSSGRLDQPCRIDVLGLLLDADLRPVRCDHIRDAVRGS